MTDRGEGASGPAAGMVDILIVGAGPVGMTLHLALAAGGQKSLLVDRRPQAALADDPRALALSHGARELLETLQAWPARAATPIETIHVSQKGGFGRTLIDRADHALPALGYVVRYRDLAAALAARLDAAACLDEAEVLAVEPVEAGFQVTVRRADGVRSLRCKVLVHAEGTPGDAPGIAVNDYAQHAVICEVGLAGAGHGGRAWERFTPDGPLAVLPLGEGAAVVFTLPPARAEAVLGLDDAAFLATLQAQFGQRLRFCRVGARSAYPLALRLRASLVAGREVWIGNCAQTLHPVSGQGFNLGLRDAWELAECLLAEGPTPAALARYAPRRRLDRQGGAWFTDRIVRLFSNDLGPLRWARGLGLLGLDLCPPARHFVAKRMIWGARAWP